MSMAAAAVGLVAAGTAVKMGQQYQEAKTGQKMAEYSQDLSLRAAASAAEAGDRNARIIERQARDRMRIARAETKQAAGAAALRFGSSGTFGGSSLQAMGDLAARGASNLASLQHTGDLEAANARHAGSLESWRYAAQAANSGAQARSYAKSIRGRMLGTLLGGGADAMTTYGAVKGAK